MIQIDDIKVEPIINRAEVKAEVVSIPPLLWHSLCDQSSERGEIGKTIADVRPDLKVLMPCQTHTANVAIAESHVDIFPDTDALVTFKRSLRIGVRTADCVPIVIWAPDVEGVAAIHAGWRGTLGGIVDNTLDVLESQGASAQKMIVAFGPSIGEARYEVDAELAKRFLEAGFSECVSYPHGEGRSPHLNLQKVNYLRLLRRGVKGGNIILNPACTYEATLPGGDPCYPSYRRDGVSASRLVTSITLLP